MATRVWATAVMLATQIHATPDEALKGTFNPLKFDPDAWAAAAHEAGMRYLVGTTKHHDGFCMFDTGLTDYRVTDPGCPFHTNPRANITREVFRDKGLGIRAHFSKPDWHSPWYWDPYKPARTLTGPQRESLPCEHAWTFRIDEPVENRPAARH
jgi:hypothetical protein